MGARVIAQKDLKKYLFTPIILATMKQKSVCKDGMWATASRNTKWQDWRHSIVRRVFVYMRATQI